MGGLKVVSVIEITDLSKNYGSFRALDNVSINVPEGSVYGYLGPNGAGKTTTLKILMGLLQYKTGSVKIFDQEVKMSLDTLKQQIGYLPDAKLPQSESINTFLVTTGKLQLVENRKKSISRVLKDLGLKNLKNRKIGNLSKGQKQRVGLANALLTNPELLILDEPNSGLDPLGRLRILSLLKELATDQGKTIILSSHIIGEIDKIATNLAIVYKGKIIEQGNRKDIVKKYLQHGKFIIEGSIDRKLVSGLDYVKEITDEISGKIAIQTTGKVSNEKILSDLLSFNETKINFFSSAELDLEDIFLESVNDQAKSEVV